MKKLLTFGLFMAAGYGTYEMLRRAGLLEKAGAWLQDNVPEDVQARVRDHVQQAKDQVQNVRGQASEQYGKLKDQATEQYGKLKGQAQEQFEHLKGQANEKLGAAKGQAQQYAKQAGERFDHAKEVVTNKLNGEQTPVGDNASMQPPVAEEGESVHTTDASHASGQTITGPGRGSDDATQEVNGGTVHHRVGRGVVHG